MTARPSRSIVLAGGGTAGHVSPLLATADALGRRGEVRITCIGTETGLEARIVPQSGYPLRTIPKVPLPRRPSLDLLRLPGALRSAVTTAGDILDEVSADAVVGFGGYVSTPVYVAARRRAIPIVVHEQNAVPGLANRVGARVAAGVAVTFPGTPLPHAVVTGMPLRTQITHADLAALRAPARAELGLPPQGPVLLVTGGSLGAQRINDAVTAAAPALAEAGVSVLHVTGRGKDFPPPTADPSVPYVVLDYVDAMERAYACADLVVARAGANTVCELTALGLPAVYVPLAIGNGEQERNAASVIEAGGGLLVRNDAFTAAWVESTIVPLLANEGAVVAMAERAAECGERGGDELLVDLVESVLR